MIVAPAVSVVKPVEQERGRLEPCADCSPQHFAERCRQVVVVVSWPHQLAEGESIQLADGPPVDGGELHPPSGSGISHLGREVIGLLPGAAVTGSRSLTRPSGIAAVH